jgi:integrase
MSRFSPSYLAQRPKHHGRWLVQMAVPKDLRGLVIGGDGKSLRRVERYLGTGDKSVAEEKKHAVVAEIKAMFARLRAGLPIPDAEIEAIAAAEEVRVYNMLDERHRDYQDHLAKLANATAYDRLFSAADDGLTNPFLDKITTEAYAANLLRQRGHAADVKSIDRVADAILKAQQSAITRIEKGMKPPAIDHTTKRTTGRSFSQLTAMYLAHPDSKFSVIGVEQRQGTYRLFQDHTGDAPLQSITRRDVSEFKAALASLHRDYGRSRKGPASLSFQELLQRFPAKGKGLSAITINRHLAALGALWKWARREGLLPDNAVSPFADQGRKVKRARKVPISVEEMNIVFDGLAYDSPLARCMAIAAYSGLRAGEVANLTAAEVKQSPQGNWYFDLTDREVNASGGKSIKSAAGRRVVPVHPRLIAAGILDHVKAVKRGPLFPQFEPKRDGSRGHALSDQFGNHAAKLGIKSRFHSFRRAFVACLDAAGIDADRKAYLTGHARSWTSRTYNDPGIAADALIDVVRAVKYEGLKSPPLETNSEST